MTIQIQKLSGLISKYVSPFLGKPSSEIQVKRQIGLNIGRSSMVACEVSFQDQNPVLERVIYKEIVKNKPLGNQIKNLFQEAKFESKQVNASLKGQGVVVRFLSFPKMNRSDFASSVQFEAEKYLPFPLAEVTLDFYILEAVNASAKETENTMRVILIAARKTDVNRLIELVQEAELKLKAVDADVFASVNAFVRSNPEMNGHSVVLVDFGAVDSTLAVLEKGVLAFSRDIAFGGNDLTEMIQRKLNVSEEEASRIQHEAKLTQLNQLTAVQEGLDRLLQELRSSLNYYYNQHQNASPIEAVYISGGFSQLSILPELLEKQLELSVKKWDPTSQLVIKETVDQKALKELIPYLPVSIGLAIRNK